jgi:DNA-3-methyladenine glycosylase
MREQRGGRPDQQLTSGPGRLCDALCIDRRFDGGDLCALDAHLFLESGTPVCDDEVSTGPRINVRGDKAALLAPWRFYIKGNPHLSH